MTKLEILHGEEIKAFFPQHVSEMINFLKDRKYNLSCYKELNSSKYILKYKNLWAEFKNCEEICLFLKDIYITEKEQEKNEYYKNLIKKELMLNHVKNSSR